MIALPYCTGCGAELALGAKFCTNCGTQFQASGPVPTSPQPQAQQPYQQPQQIPPASTAIQQAPIQQGAQTGFDVKKGIVLGAIVFVIGFAIFFFIMPGGSEAAPPTGTTGPGVAETPYEGVKTWGDDSISWEVGEQTPIGTTQGTLQVISVYSCEGGHPDCQVEGNLCFLMRNNGNTVVPMADLGAAQVVYEIPGAPEMGQMPVLTKFVGATLSGSGSDACCPLADMGAAGRCGEHKSIASRETFLLSFVGFFKDGQGNSRLWYYGDAKDNRVIISLNLPSGLHLTHQVT